MGFIFMWFFIMFIIILIASNANNKNNNKIPNKYKEINSYYSDRKINSYKKQEDNHKNHEKDEFDKVCSEIGYKRCPKCDSTISKKSDECFMCGYKF